MKNLSKNKSCIGGIAWHGILYFFKSFRSLEEFKKNPIFNSKISFLHFRPGRPCGPLGRWPSRPCWPLSSHGPNSTLPAQLAHVSMAYLRKYVFPFSSRLPSWPQPSRLSVKWAWAVSFVFLPHRPTVATSSRHLRPPRATPPPTSRCRARSSLHTLIPLLNFTP
jgi:hypothetical protein